MYSCFVSPGNLYFRIFLHYYGALKNFFWPYWWPKPELSMYVTFDRLNSLQNVSVIYFHILPLEAGR